MEVSQVKDYIRQLDKEIQMAEAWMHPSEAAHRGSDPSLISEVSQQSPDAAMLRSYHQHDNSDSVDCAAPSFNHILSSSLSGNHPGLHSSSLIRIHTSPMMPWPSSNIDPLFDSTFNFAADKVLSLLDRALAGDKVWNNVAWFGDILIMILYTSLIIMLWWFFIHFIKLLSLFIPMLKIELVSLSEHIWVFWHFRLFIFR